MARGSYSPDGEAYAYGSPSKVGTKVLRWGHEGASVLHKGVDGASDGTAWSNTDRLVTAVDGEGLLTIDSASEEPTGPRRFANFYDEFYDTGSA